MNIQLSYTSSHRPLTNPKTVPVTLLLREAMAAV